MRALLAVLLLVPSVALAEPPRIKPTCVEDAKHRECWVPHGDAGRPRLQAVMPAQAAPTLPESPHPIERAVPPLPPREQQVQLPPQAYEPRPRIYYQQNVQVRVPPVVFQIMDVLHQLGVLR